MQRKKVYKPVKPFTALTIGTVKHVYKFKNKFFAFSVGKSVILCQLMEK